MLETKVFTTKSFRKIIFFRKSIKDQFTLLNSHDPKNVRYSGVVLTQAWNTISVESRLIPFTVKKFKT